MKTANKNYLVRAAEISGDGYEVRAIIDDWETRLVHREAVENA